MLKNIYLKKESSGYQTSDDWPTIIQFSANKFMKHLIKKRDKLSNVPL